MAVEVTRNWTASRLSQQVSAHESFDVTGVTTLLQALNANGAPFGPVPKQGVTHIDDPSLYASPPVGQIITPGAHFRIEVDFLPLNLQVGIAPTNPLDAPPKFSWSNEDEAEETDIDLFGNPLANSVGDPIDPPPQIILTTRILRVTRWESNYSISTADAFEWKTNDDPIHVAKTDEVIPEGCMLCRAISPTGEYDERSTAIQIQYLFAVRAAGWLWRFLDHGYRAWYTDSTDSKNKLAEFFSKADGTQFSRPCRLNGKGKPYAADSVILSKSAKTPIEIGKPTGAHIEDTGKAVFLKYFRYDGASFGALGIF